MRTNDKYVISFQMLSFNFQVGIIAHQVGHALGFFHEHSRFDRDTYVHINLENIDLEYLSQFEKIDTSLMNTFGLPYDFASVMHYGTAELSKKQSFPRNYLASISAQNPMNVQTIGQRIRLSFLDIIRMNIFYQCSGMFLS
jgi:hypothetical protein